MKPQLDKNLYGYEFQCSQELEQQNSPQNLCVIIFSAAIALPLIPVIETE